MPVRTKLGKGKRSPGSGGSRRDTGVQGMNIGKGLFTEKGQRARPPSVPGLGIGKPEHPHGAMQVHKKRAAKRKHAKT